MQHLLTVFELALRIHRHLRELRLLLRPVGVEVGRFRDLLLDVRDIDTRAAVEEHLLGRSPGRGAGGVLVALDVLAVRVLHVRLDADEAGDIGLRGDAKGIARLERSIALLVLAVVALARPLDLRTRRHRIRRDVLRTDREHDGLTALVVDGIRLVGPALQENRIPHIRVNTYGGHHRPDEHICFIHNDCIISNSNQVSIPADTGPTASREPVRLRRSR